jgi:hypothetical protein
MIRTDADEDSMRSSLDEVVELFEQAKSSVFKLMASVSCFEDVHVCQSLTILRTLFQNSFAIRPTQQSCANTISISLQATGPSHLAPREQHLVGLTHLDNTESKS